MNTSLITSLYTIGAIQFGEFQLKSGQTSTIYINLRKIISYPNILRMVANLMWEKVKPYQFDLVCGVPYTALPIATCVSLEQNIPMIMRRKEKKEYGTKQSIEGEFKSGSSCLIIEDVITTGSSILETALDLQQSGLNVQNVIALIDREQGGLNYLNQKFKAESILTLSEVLNFLRTSTLLSKIEKNFIDKFLDEKCIA